MKRSDIDRVALGAATWGERRCGWPPRSPPAEDGGRSGKVVCLAGGRLTQMERDTSGMTLFLFLLCVYAFFFLIDSAGTMGKGTIMHAGRGAVGVATQVAASQKNKLNDPGGGGGSFRCEWPVCRDCRAGWSHVGAAFHHEASPRSHSHSHTEHYTHTHTHTSLQATLSAKAMSVYPSWPPGHLAGWLPVRLLPGWLVDHRQPPLPRPPTIPSLHGPAGRQIALALALLLSVSRAIDRITDELNLILAIR